VNSTRARIGPWLGLFAWRLAFWFTAAGVGLFAVWPWIAAGPQTEVQSLVLYGFSILGEVMQDGVFPAFQAEWQAKTGQPVEFVSSFAGSGTITNQIILGVPAEVVILSLELDAFRLEDAGRVAGPTWQELPYGGVLNRTPFIILVRPDNPRQVQDFADLTEAGIGIIHPDPLTSGGAQWAILAEYGSVLFTGGDEAQAERQLLDIWRNVSGQAASARAARTQFESGFGDALITYEQEVVFDRARGRLEGDIVYPLSTIQSEHIVVRLDENIPPERRALAMAFTDFLWSETAQRVFVEYGFRSVFEELNAANPDFGTIEVPFTVTDLGGWKVARAEIVEQIWRDRVLPQVHP
jgi:sulfate transport system substrate-binding protein